MAGFVTRFAPSPTGPLHLGHAYSALLAHDMARQAGGTFVLRIEDIDQSRCRPEWEAQIYDDLQWLGLRWPDPVLRQSARLDIYRQGLDRLWAEGLLYACSCSRRDIEQALSAPQEGADLPTGPDGLIYPGTCRPNPGQRMPSPAQAALRLNMDLATEFEKPPGTSRKQYRFLESGAGPEGQTGVIGFDGETVRREIGDVAIARREFGTSYHLAVVLDDASQGVSHVVRGEDLFDATRIHVLLQDLLGLPTPAYHHHRLIRDDQGKRLAKRDDARALAKYRAEGATPQDIRRMVGL